jgi:hypothetical protein
MPESISPSPNEVLQALLDAHGYQATISGERVVIAGHTVQLSSEVFLRSETAPAQLQLDVRVHLPDGRTLIESFAGIGESLQYALGDGFDNFSRSSWHVLLNAFLDGPEGTGVEQDSSEEWQLPLGRFTAWMGDAVFRGQPSGKGEELVAWVQPFASAIRQAPPGAGQSHWIRLFYAQYQGEMMTCEVLLDGEPWEEMQHEIKQFPWPRGEAFYSARLFLVLQPAR